MDETFEELAERTKKNRWGGDKERKIGRSKWVKAWDLHEEIGGALELQVSPGGGGFIYMNYSSGNCNFLIEFDYVNGMWGGEVSYRDDIKDGDWKYIKGFTTIYNIKVMFADWIKRNCLD